ncbi:YncE family protein [Pontibacter populi]|uniref:YncE family protein n=1 Tax=Pontibacter populi TaxID=890055 RepID=A0ABV1RXR6_9BACT
MLLKKYFIAVLLLTSILPGCNDLMVHEEQTIPLNINYPAAFVVNGKDNTISVIKLSEMKVTETIKLKDATTPHHITLSPDKKQLAVAITSADLSGGHGGMEEEATNYKVIILDAETGLVIKTIVLPKMPHNAVYNATGDELWMGQQADGAGSVIVYNTTDWSIKDVIPVGKSPSEITFSADGSWAFVANTDDATVSVIDPVTKSISATLQVGEDPVGAWPAADGNMYVDNETSQTISILNVATKTIAETLNLGFKPGYAAYQEKTGELWVSNATDGKVVIYSRNNNSWQRKTEIATGADAHAIIFSEDQKLAYVTNQGAHTVSVINTADYSKVTTLSVGRMPNGIVIR